MGTKANVKKNKYHNIYFKISFVSILLTYLSLFFLKIYHYLISHPLLTFSIRRIFWGIITVIITIFVFYLVIRISIQDYNFAPPNKAENQPPEYYKEYEKEQMRIYHLDGSIFAQAFHYLYMVMPIFPKNVDGVVTLVDFGKASVNIPGIVEKDSSINALFSERIPVSLMFGGLSVVLAYLVGVPLGIEAARHYDKKTDKVVNFIFNLLVVVPSVVIVITFFFITATSGNSVVYADGGFSTFIMPLLSIVFMLLPFIVINTRRHMLDEMNNEYIKFALSCGMSNFRVYYLYVFRVAGVKILHQLPTDLILALFGVSILTETQWGIPGMGKMIGGSFSATKDIFTVMGYATLVAFSGIFSKLISDIVCAVFDPRVALHK